MNDERFDKLNESLQWVECDNKKNCTSYQIRLKETGCEGGDWFHLKCIDLNILPQSRVFGFVTFANLEKQSFLPRIVPFFQQFLPEA